MFNYKRIIQWHEEKNTTMTAEEQESKSMFGDDYFKNKFDQGIGRIWQVFEYLVVFFVPLFTFICF